MSLVLMGGSCGAVKVDAVGGAIWPDYTEITPAKPTGRPVKPSWSNEEDAQIRKWAAEHPALWKRIQDRNRALQDWGEDLEAWGDKLAAILRIHNADAADHNAVLLEGLGVHDEKSVAKLESALAALKKKKGLNGK